MLDYLVVGAGLFGSVCARELTDAGKTVQVIERRDHIGGNCYTEERDGIIMNKYGGHIFHTKSRRIWDYLSRFTEWQQYEHRVKVSSGGIIYSFPPNKMTLQQLRFHTWEKARDEIEQRFFRGYTEKQWGRPFEDVPKHIIQRIPYRDNWDDRYFDDPWQGLPEGGYTPLFERMLDGIVVTLDANYLDDREYWRGKAKQVIYTGPLDELYQGELGFLEYRGLKFKHARYEVESFQGCATMNFPDAEAPFTRRIEWKHFWHVALPYTWVTTEYPDDYTGKNEPYYPIGDAQNRRLHKQYEQIAEREGYITGGRLGSYQYLNMDQAIGAALATVERLQ